MHEQEENRKVYFSGEMEGRREEEGELLPKNTSLHHIENAVDMVK